MGHRRFNPNPSHAPLAFPKRTGLVVMEGSSSLRAVVLSTNANGAVDHQHQHRHRRDGHDCGDGSSATTFMVSDPWAPRSKRPPREAAPPSALGRVFGWRAIAFAFAAFGLGAGFMFVSEFLEEAPARRANGAYHQLQADEMGSAAPLSFIAPSLAVDVDELDSPPSSALDIAPTARPVGANVVGVDREKTLASVVRAQPARPALPASRSFSPPRREPPRLR